MIPRVGKKMRACVHYVCAHPGATVAETADAIATLRETSYYTRRSSGAAVVLRCAAAGLINRAGSRRLYRLHATQLGWALNMQL